MPGFQVVDHLNDTLFSVLWSSWGSRSDSCSREVGNRWRHTFLYFHLEFCFRFYEIQEPTSVLGNWLAGGCGNGRLALGFCNLGSQLDSTESWSWEMGETVEQDDEQEAWLWDFLPGLLILILHVSFWQYFSLSLDFTYWLYWLARKPLLRSFLCIHISGIICTCPHANILYGCWGY